MYVTGVHKSPEEVELNSTYTKQLRKLHDDEVLTEEKCDEQRTLTSSMVIMSLTTKIFICILFFLCN